MSEKDWDAAQAKAEENVRRAAQIADQRPVSEPSQVTRFVFSEDDALQDEGGHAERRLCAASYERVSQRPKARAST